MNIEDRTELAYIAMGDGRWIWLKPIWGSQPGLGIDWHLLPESEWEVANYPNMEPTHWMRSPVLPSTDRIGEFVADYSPLSAEDIAKEDPKLTKLHARSRPGSSTDRQTCEHGNHLETCTVCLMWRSLPSSTYQSAPVDHASHNSGERLPSSDAAAAGADTAVPSTDKSGAA